MRAYARNRAAQKRVAASSLTDFASYLLGQPFILRPFHHLQNIAYLLVGEDIQERRLFQLYTQPLLQCVVENRIAGGVGEIREHDGVFLRKTPRLPRAPQQSSGDSRCKDNYTQR